MKKSQKPEQKSAEYSSAEELFRTHVPGYSQAERNDDDEVSCASDSFTRIATGMGDELQSRIAGTRKS